MGNHQWGLLELFWDTTSICPNSRNFSNIVGLICEKMNRTFIKVTQEVFLSDCYNHLKFSILTATD